MALNSTIDSFFGTYTSGLSMLPDFIQNFINLFIIVLIVFIYAIFIWKFYRFLSTKNIIELNLNQYNRSNNPTAAKLLAIFFYFIEYIVILPFLIFFWFSVFSIFLIFLTEELPVSALLLVSAVIIAAIRMAAYYNENLAQDLAKLIPLTLLSVSFLNPGFFSLERILNHLSEIPSLTGSIFTYLMFIVLFEILLRFLYFIFSLFGIEEEEEESQEQEKSN